jgi:hypothetical protein
MSESRLFDLALGEQFTFIKRDEQWVLVTEVDQRESARLLQSLKVRVREPRAGMSIGELPEQEVLLARNGTTLVVGPSKSPQLFYEILPRLDNANDALRTGPCLAITESLGSGRIGVLMRNPPLAGGQSALVADLNGSRLRIRHAAKFDHPPFARNVTELECDFSPMTLFENHALLALMQPTDIGPSPVEAFIAADLGEPFASKQMRSNFGERRLLVIGEVEGRQLERPVDLLSTTFASCVQIKNPEHAIEDLDEQMLKITKRIKHRGEGAFLVKVPPIAHLRPDEPRVVDLSAASEWFTGGFPIMKNVALSWTVADGPHGHWFVVASHRQSLDDVVKSLNTPAPSLLGGPELKGRFDHCGTANGIRISRHLQSWMDQAEQFAEEGKAEEFRATLRLVSEFAGGLKTCRWQMARPTPNEMRLDVQMELAPPESPRKGE